MNFALNHEHFVSNIIMFLAPLCMTLLVGFCRVSELWSHCRSTSSQESAQRWNHENGKENMSNLNHLLFLPSFSLGSDCNQNHLNKSIIYLYRSMLWFFFFSTIWNATSFQISSHVHVEQSIINEWIFTRNNETIVSFHLLLNKIFTHYTCQQRWGL